MHKEAENKRFPGFTNGQGAIIPLPEAIFTDLIPYIDDILELKLTLIVLWRLSQIHAEAAPWITREELEQDEVIQAARSEEEEIGRALSSAVARGTLLLVTRERSNGSCEERYFANSPKARTAIAAMQRGREPARSVSQERPNIYALYEQNIGTLTPLLAEELRDAEETYPEEWIEEAFREAVGHNKRNWRYILAILKNWQEKGRHEIHQRDRKTDRRRYIEGEYADLIQH